MGYDVIHPGVHLLVHQASFNRLLDHGIGHGVGEMFFQAGGDPQQFILILPVKRHHISHLGPCLCQGACLVKYNGVRCRHRLHILAALYRDVVAAGLAHGRQHG